MSALVPLLLRRQLKMQLQRLMEQARWRREQRLLLLLLRSYLALSRETAMLLFHALRLLAGQTSPKTKSPARPLRDLLTMTAEQSMLLLLPSRVPHW